MCGIVGFNWNNKEDIHKATKTLSHRGPDDFGIYVSDAICLGQTRLSIIDLTYAGHQPIFYSKDKGSSSGKYLNANKSFGKYILVYNGEIYNFKELKEELIKHGYVFTTKCDTEIIPASYDFWGYECFNKFNGMWALCLYDLQKQELILSRDRTGQKPLYYYSEGNKFIFASELKAIFPFINKEINTDSLHSYIVFGFSQPKETLVKDIKKLSPGSFLIYNLHSKKIIANNAYWSINFNHIDSPKEIVSSTILSILEDSVKKRMIADVPVGAFLSGGLDSSIIVSLMRKHTSQLKTFSISFEHKDFNESSFASIVAKKFQTEHYEIRFTSNDVKNYIEQLPYFYDDPIGDASMIPTYLVSKVASQHVKVCLSGTGSDELFAGYSRYKEFLVLQRLSRMPGFIKYFVTRMHMLYSNNRDKNNKLQILLKEKANSSLYLKLFSPLFRGDNEFVFDDRILDLYAGFLNQGDLLSSILNFDQKVYLPEDLLVKEDRATMAHSIEGRIPFLDYRLINYANSLHNQYKLKFHTGKYILKSIFSDVLPPEITNRNKKGFGVPLVHYIRDELKDYFYNSIFGFKKIDYYDTGIVKDLWNRHQEGSSDYSPLFWKIVLFNQWYEKWM